MKLVRGSEIDYQPASHEDPKDPGVLKKVLLQKQDLIKGQIMMVNWAHLPVGKSFAAHYHEDMQEVFILVSGQVKMTIENETVTMNPGDTVVVPIKAVHTMKNISDQPAEYIVFGVSLEQGGKTINV